MAALRFACLTLWLGCSLGAPAASPPPLRILTSFLPVYCFTVNVAADLATVENFLPAGVGPHEYQFAPRDLERLQAADLVVVNGLQLESWASRALRGGALRHPARLVSAAAGLDHELIYTSASSGSPTGRPPAAAVPNPHTWLDPRLAAHAVTNILRALQEADPPNAARYATNAARYLERLQSLDADLRRATAGLRHQPFITSHNAFPYFTRRYGLDLVGTIEETPDVDPSPRSLARLSQSARQVRVKAIFTEPQTNTRLADQLGRDLGVPVAELDTLETGPLSPTAYEDGLRRNLAVLAKYLR